MERYCFDCGALLMFDEKEAAQCSTCQIRALRAEVERLGRCMDQANERANRETTEKVMAFMERDRLKEALEIAMDWWKTYNPSQAPEIEAFNGCSAAFAGRGE